MDLPDRGRALAAFLDSLVKDPDLFPVYDNYGKLLKTFCNIGARRCSPGEDFHDFDGDILADEMGRIMVGNSSGKWKLVSGAEASLWAMQGGRAMAFMSSKELDSDHGHIARVYPKPMAISGSLKKPVPWVANIGKGDPGKPVVNMFNAVEKRVSNWVCKASQAFPVAKGEPRYFLYTG